MMTDEILFHIQRHFRFHPTTEQEEAIQTFAHFLTARDPHSLMILTGSAGTGKTSIAGAIVQTLTQLRQKVVLMAPTGRAAKVFSMNSDGHPAFTIHRKIYRQRTFDGSGGRFNLNDNLFTDTLFMVDEASMVANLGAADTTFGSGCLLDDLVQYVYAGRNCRLLLIGDKAQLPPVGETESPALLAHVMEGYGMTVFHCDLSEVLRQNQDSGILFNATRIREMITREHLTQLPQIRLTAFADVTLVSGDELVDRLNSSYNQVGTDETIVITRSNKRANIFNRGIRGMVLECEEMLVRGDLLMIVKNNYYWTEREKSSISFLANGDRARVVRVSHQRKEHDLHFADVWLQFPDYENLELEATIVLESLTTEAPALTREQNEHLYNKVMEDYADIPLKADRMKKVKNDVFFNALQIKYAYAITCHKAQGGQWEHVFLDQGYVSAEALTPDYLHWLYTAFTRARSRLFLVNWPQAQCEET